MRSGTEPTLMDHFSLPSKHVELVNLIQYTGTERITWLASKKTTTSTKSAPSPNELHRTNIVILTEGQSRRVLVTAYGGRCVYLYVTGASRKLTLTH